LAEKENEVQALKENEATLKAEVNKVRFLGKQTIKPITNVL
jgi:hypothetical protein